MLFWWWLHQKALHKEVHQAPAWISFQYQPFFKKWLLNATISSVIIHTLEDTHIKRNGLFVLIHTVPWNNSCCLLMLQAPRLFLLLKQNHTTLAFQFICDVENTSDQWLDLPRFHSLSPVPTKQLLETKAEIARQTERKANSCYINM